MTAPKKIAVLGGGTGSMATVWALTSLPDWQQRFEITVYQMGWRLGGKGASGRNAAHGERIEEHGLHVWAGFYDNAFRMIREVYEAWAIAPQNPIQSWRDAFKPQSRIILEEQINGRWEHWQVDCPPLPGEPGDRGDHGLDVWSYILKLLDWLVAYLADNDLYDGRAETYGGASALWRALTALSQGASARLESVLQVFDPPTLIRAARDFARRIGEDVFSHRRADHARLIALLEAIVRQIERDFSDQLDQHPEARRLYYLVDMSLGTIKGLLLDGVVFRGWDSIDFYEWRDWMRRWGVSEYTLDGVLVRAVYDYVFGFPNGRAGFARLGAGTAIHGSLRLVFTYRGALFYFMQGGMGDIVFSPLYETLKARGVKFEFFSKVERLELNEAQDAIERVVIARQATLKEEGAGYEPLVDVLGFPCWPSEPRYEQLNEGEALRRDRINLESNWTSWRAPLSFELERGVGFDEVVLGIPCTSFPYIAAELMVASEAFERMVRGMESTQTQAVQLWFDRSGAELGAPDRPIISTAYIDPINTWADMSHLIKRELWPAGGHEPKFIAYFCGPLQDATHIPDFSDHDFPRRERERVEQGAIAWLSQHAGFIWQQSGTASDPGALDFNALHGPGHGVEKMRAQYVRANIDPSERYVLSTPATVQLRLKARSEDFKNLVVTGDWVYTSLSAGCIECCAMAGLHAAEALSGERFEISDRGYDALWPPAE